MDVELVWRGTLPVEIAVTGLPIEEPDVPRAVELFDTSKLDCAEGKGAAEVLLVNIVTVKGPVSGKDVVLLLVESVTVNGAVSGRDMVVTLVEYGLDVVLEKPTGEPNLESEAVVTELIAELAVGR